MSTAPELPGVQTQADPMQRLREYKGLLEEVTDETAKRQASETLGHSISTMMYIGKDYEQYQSTMKKVSFGSLFGFNAAQSVSLIAIDPKTKEPALKVEGRKLLLHRKGYSWKPLEHTKEACHLEFYLNGDLLKDGNGNPARIKFTMQDGVSAGWAGKAGKDYDNWSKIPESMLHASVIRRFCQWWVPDLLDDESNSVVTDQTKPINEAAKAEHDAVKAALKGGN